MMRKPKVVILGTGGTIAGKAGSNTEMTGYQAGEIGIQTLINAVPEMLEVADVTGEQMSDKAPYNLEFLIEKDPEIIFITSMGDKNDIEVRLQNDVMSSPAWESITAVKNNAVYYLPDELFLLNPGLRYSQAVEYMASKLQE